MAPLDNKTLQGLKDLANKLRVHSIQSTNAAGSGHPTSCTSAAEIMSVLFFHTMRYKVHSPRDPANDRFVLSKGHAAPILYAAWAEAGLFSLSELMNLRKITSDLEGHPTPRLNFVDVATGSLGQGLSFAAGMAYTGKYWDKADYRVYCLLGDGESAEGSVFEALAFASHYKLDNLVAIFDVNRQGQSDPTALQHDMETYKSRMESLGWNTVVVDGTSVEEIAEALEVIPKTKNAPTCVLAKTLKGGGCPGVEDLPNFHGKALGAKGDAVVETIMAKIKNKGAHGLYPNPPVSDVAQVDISNIRLSSPPDYKLGQQIAVRIGYSNGLLKIGKNNSRVIALDGDMKNSTYAEVFMKAFPERFVECYIAEQNMTGVAIGACTRGRAVAFVSTFGTFLTRAYDQIRMGAISQTNVNFAGSHCGISIGPDGPSQMALEDIAMFRSIPESTVFYPSDAVSGERAVELAANQPGICFIRVTRPETSVLYKNDEIFEIGKAKIVRQSNRDQVTVIGAGVTLMEALRAADQLAVAGIQIRVIDPFTVKPIDVDTIRQSALQTGGRVITIEDHYAEGGLGEAVSSALSEERGIGIRRLAVTALPRSGATRELLDMFGISAKHVVEAVRELIKS